MKKVFLLFASFCFLACSEAPSTDKTTLATTPEGLEGINKANAQANTSGEKLNPEHGMPGHDCALPVGAPLKKDSTVKIETVSTEAPATQQANGIKPKNNPAHGMPYHDCALAVGAPLG